MAPYDFRNGNLAILGDDDNLLFAACINNAPSLLKDLLANGDELVSSCNYAALRCALANCSQALVTCFEDCKKVPHLELLEITCELLNIHQSQGKVFNYLFGKRMQYHTEVFRHLEAASAVDTVASCLVNMAYLERYWQCVEQSFAQVDRFGNIAASATGANPMDNAAIRRGNAIRLTLAMLKGLQPHAMCCYFLRQRVVKLADFQGSIHEAVELERTVEFYYKQCIAKRPDDALAVKICFRHEGPIVAEPPVAQESKNQEDGKSLCDSMPPLEPISIVMPPLVSIPVSSGRSILDEAVAAQQEAAQREAIAQQHAQFWQSSMTQGSKALASVTMDALAEKVEEKADVQEEKEEESESEEEEEDESEEEEEEEEKKEVVVQTVESIDWKRCLALVVQEHEKTRSEFLQRLYLILIRAKRISHMLPDDFEESAFLCAGATIFQAVAQNSVASIERHHVEFFDAYVKDAQRRLSQ